MCPTDSSLLKGCAAPLYPNTEVSELLCGGDAQNSSKPVPGLKARSTLQLGSTFGSWEFSISLSHTPACTHIAQTHCTSAVSDAALWEASPWSTRCA